MVSTAGLASVSDVAEPADLGKMEGDKSQPGHSAETGHGQVSSRRDIEKH